MTWWDTLAERWRQLDRQLAGDMLKTFEAKTGRNGHSRMPASGVRSLELQGVRELLSPGGLAVVEHHWATWCDACLEDLPRVEELHVSLGGRARVIGVSWERFADARPATDVLAHVERFLHTHGLTFPNAVFEGDHADLVAGLRLPVDTIPVTRLIDRDGGVLRVFHGPLSDADVRYVLSMFEQV